MNKFELSSMDEIVLVQQEQKNSKTKALISWENLVIDLTENSKIYHQQFYKYNNFRGPSLYFHIRALNSQGKEKSEMTYATLVSWGMHRMGGGAQMNEYNIFQESINSAMKFIQKLESKDLVDLNENDWNTLHNIFETLNPMLTKKKIVAVSKVLAHYIPNLIAPIDNEYTFQFINQKPLQKNLPRNWDEFELFQELHLKLFKKVIENSTFKNSALKWINNSEFPWDTSLPKIIDNLIIGKIKHLKNTDENYMKIKTIKTMQHKSTKEQKKLTDYHWKKRKELLNETDLTSNQQFSLEQMRAQTEELNRQIDKKKF